MDLCGDEHFCENTFGSYRCICPQGFTSSKEGNSCLDIDECSEGYHDCSHICRNSQGSYSCSCPVGYYLGRDMKTCKSM